MKVIGLTGGIASGKTEVANIFKRYGIKVIHTDEIGHNYLFHPEIKGKIVDIYGEDILTDGQIDRNKLGKIVFSNNEEKKRINTLIHPLIIADIINRIQQAHEEGHKIVIIESALIAEDEDQLPNWLNGLILVVCPEEIRIQRLINTRNLTLEEAKLRIQSQRKPEEKITMANWIINNVGDLKTLEEETEKIIEEIYDVAR